MKKVVIIGGGGHARNLIDILSKTSGLQLVGITDIRKDMEETFEGDIPVLGTDLILPELIKKGVHYTIIGVGSVGNPQKRIELFKHAQSIGFKFINAIHSWTWISSKVTLGVGNAIMPGVVINPNVIIGNNTIINTGVIIEHDCRIEDNIHIGPGAKIGGGVMIRKDTHVGIGSTIIQGINIGENVIIGAGSVVIKDVPDNITVVGVPAKILRRNLA